MDSVYGTLSDKLRREGLCPICVMETDLGPKYTCSNEHTICYRCKPYYYSCPICQSSFDTSIPAAHGASSFPMPTDFVPHSLPPRFYSHHPTAPPICEFMEREGNRMPPHPPGHQELKTCAYRDFGCWVKLPIYLDLHESRNIGPYISDNVSSVLTWRKRCPSPAMTPNEHHGRPEELVECKYRKYGCMVNMPRRRKLLHQEQCNYRKYAHSDSDLSTNSDLSTDNEYDPQNCVACKWTQYGCRVRPKINRLKSHEMNCNYRMEECAYKSRGCTELFKPPRKFAHEKNCQFSNF
ncbi:PREDICTED: uncharacterized protein LOC108551852 [Eufriesea mexicana]|uniref:uncharacterized protein LOC108551852 n=1 Tax=Eufriesea mexicana TaxID=516756 RepID=UPI00083BB3AC|nr:PREDICTED: uncharacterized protein LOC108551852 [Eufriesea mexicana]